VGLIQFFPFFRTLHEIWNILCAKDVNQRAVQRQQLFFGSQSTDERHCLGDAELHDNKTAGK